MEFIFEANKKGVLNAIQLKLGDKTYNIKDIKTSDYIVNTNCCVLTLKTGEILKFKITDITSDLGRQSGSASYYSENFTTFLEAIVEKFNYDITFCD